MDSAHGIVILKSQIVILKIDDLTESLGNDASSFRRKPESSSLDFFNLLDPGFHRGDNFFRIHQRFDAVRQLKASPKTKKKK